MAAAGRRHRSPPPHPLPTGRQGGRARPYACTRCLAAFAERFNLARHVRTVHERGAHFVCLVCCRGFSRWDNAVQHNRAVHGASTRAATVALEGFAPRPF